MRPKYLEKISYYMKNLIVINRRSTHLLPKNHVKCKKLHISMEKNLFYCGISPHYVSLIILTYKFMLFAIQLKIVYYVLKFHSFYGCKLKIKIMDKVEKISLLGGKNSKILRNKYSICFCT